MNVAHTMHIIRFLKERYGLTLYKKKKLNKNTTIKSVWYKNFKWLNWNTWEQGLIEYNTKYKDWTADWFVLSTINSMLIFYK